MQSQKLSHLEQIGRLVPRDRLRSLMRRTNRDATAFLIAHMGWLAVTASLIYLTRGTMWVIPAMFVFGIGIVHLFAAQHEFAHRTAFRTRWLNDVLGSSFGFLIMLPHVYFRWEHTAHHTYTQDTRRDPQLIPQPRSLGAYLFYLSTVPYWMGFLRPFCRHLIGIVTSEENRFLPETERWKVIWEARAMLIGYSALGLASVALHSGVLLYFWLLPRLFAEPVMRYVRMTEHVGRPLNTLDLLINTRTTAVSRLLRMLAWNMPFHAEHHLAPSVPFHALPALNAALAGLQRPIVRGYRGAHIEILRNIGPALR